jgi:Rrf2 family iron-sulfur cluster assembly transcriptional regulator
VVDAVDETVDATRCQGLADCQGGHTCLTHHLWCELSEAIHGFLAGVTLGDMIERQEVRDIAARQRQSLGGDRIAAESS